MPRRKKPVNESIVVAADEPTAKQLAAFYERTRSHPLGRILVEDLAASREHGTVTARVGIGPDGCPIVYGQDEAVVKRIGEAMLAPERVSLRPIPELTTQQFQLLGAQAAGALSAPPAVVAGVQHTSDAQERADGVHDPTCPRHRAKA
jgi:hypothetical protein